LIFWIISRVNRRNSLNSTGPKTDLCKQRASQNAVRHGLTAETVIVPLEDADDYQAFEQAVTADYEAETAVERELVLRLASLLWRLRRATSIETALLQIEPDELLPPSAQPEVEPHKGCAVTTLFPGRQSTGGRSDEDGSEDCDARPTSHFELDVARRFLRLADLDNGVFERLGRYEAALWRQVRQTLFTLEALRWRNFELPQMAKHYIRGDEAIDEIRIAVPPQQHSRRLSWFG
jgi:hypothetical protein